MKAALGTRFAAFFLAGFFAAAFFAGFFAAFEDDFFAELFFFVAIASPVNESGDRFLPTRVRVTRAKYSREY
jgi:hypothetical protein